MIDKIMRDVCAAVSGETGRIKEEHGETYHSTHEAYGVLCEEIFEAEEEFCEVSSYKAFLMDALHRDDSKRFREVLDVIRFRALKGACELIQVAAVCQKAVEGMEDGERA